MIPSKPIWVSKYDPGVAETLIYPSIPLHDVLKEKAQRIPERICVYYQGGEFSYSQINSLSTKMAATLIQQGIQKGDRVGLIMGNTPAFVYSFFGILRAGGIVVAINPKSKLAEIETTVEDSGINLLITERNKSAEVASLKGAWSAESIIHIPAGEGVNIPAVIQQISQNDEFDQRIFEPESMDEMSCQFPAVNPDDAAIFQYSGGTTGTPKAAVGLHRNLVANIHQFAAWLTNFPSTNPGFLSVIPFYHVYGMVLGMCLPIHMGSAMVLIKDARDANGILNAIKRYHPAVFPAVPNMFSLLMNSQKFSEIEKGSLSVCISGSAPLDAHVKSLFEEKTGAIILEGYGLSEAPTATHCNPLSGENKTGSIGLPLPDVDSRIVDPETGGELACGDEPGELIIQGPQIMAGYFNQGEETKKTLRDGWLFTGDIARMDEDGYFYIIGRKKELIKVSGFQVWPAEVEKVIKSHPAVRDAVVAGIPDQKTGERPKAWIILQEGCKVSRKELGDHCRKSLSDYKVPKEYQFVEEFPRSHVGKILRRELIRLDNQKKHPG